MIHTIKSSYPVHKALISEKTPSTKCSSIYNEKYAVKRNDAYPHSKVDFGTCWLLFRSCNSKKVISRQNQEPNYTQAIYQTPFKPNV